MNDPLDGKIALQLCNSNTQPKVKCPPYHFLSSQPLLESLNNDYEKGSEFGCNSLIRIMERKHSKPLDTIDSQYLSFLKLNSDRENGNLWVYLKDKIETNKKSSLIIVWLKPKD